MIRNIFISWRRKAGEGRYIIASIKRNGSGIVFKYNKEFLEAQKEGLEHFMGFKDEIKLSPKEIENLLSLRIISRDRPDREEYLDFWEAKGIEDTLDLLAYTQGKSPTDNFEFLADFLTVKGKLKFVTDLAGLSHSKIPEGTVKVGDQLIYLHEKDNQFDSDAVAVYLNEIKLGYIKKIHNRVFKLKRKLKLTVKAVDDNLITKQIFVKVEK